MKNSYGSQMGEILSGFPPKPLTGFRAAENPTLSDLPEHHGNGRPRGTSRSDRDRWIVVRQRRPTNPSEYESPQQPRAAPAASTLADIRPRRVPSEPICAFFSFS